MAPLLPAAWRALEVPAQSQRLDPAGAGRQGRPDPGVLSYLENGSRSGSLESLLKLAEALGVEPEQLMAGKLLPGTKGKDFPTLSLEA